MKRMRGLVFHSFDPNPAVFEMRDLFPTLGSLSKSILTNLTLQRLELLAVATDRFLCDCLGEKKCTLKDKSRKICEGSQAVSISHFVRSPATMPEVIVAITGVLDRSLILDRNLKSSPSSAMAHMILGIGNMEPSRLVEEETERERCT